MPASFRVLAEVHLDAAVHVLAPIGIVVARRPHGPAVDVDFHDAIEVLQFLRIEVVWVEEIPRDDVEAAFARLRQ